MILSSASGEAEIGEPPEVGRNGWVKLEIPCGGGPNIRIESDGGFIDVGRGISRKLDSGYRPENSSAENGLGRRLTDVPVPAR